MNQILIRNNKSASLLKIIDEKSYKRIFLVTGGNSYKVSGAEEFIKEINSRLETTRFFEFSNNPKYEDVLNGVNLFSSSSYDIIIAIGGGSVIDMAKLINVFSNIDEKHHLNVINGSSNDLTVSTPLIAVPTTSGSGSEATHFAVMYHNDNKCSIAGKQIMPDVAFLNDEFISTQNAYLKSCTGLDALAQAIESYWSVQSTFESRKYAEESIRLLLDNLEYSVNNNNQESNKNLSYASYLAGKAINISKTTFCHAVSYSITNHYGIPHGHAVFMTLPETLRYNYNINKDNCNDKRGHVFVKKNMEELLNLLGSNDIIDTVSNLRNLVKRIGVNISFKDNNISNTDLDFIFNNINKQRLLNNPRMIDVKEIKELFLDT